MIGREGGPGGRRQESGDVRSHKLGKQGKDEAGSKEREEGEKREKDALWQGASPSGRGLVENDEG